MSRIRSCKPTFYDNIKLAELSIPARYFFHAMWHWLDRNGVGERNARYWKSKVFPFDDDISASKVEEIIQTLIKQDRLRVLYHEDKELLHCPAMPEHQHFHMNETPKYEFSLLNSKSTVQAPYNDGTVTVLARRKSEIGDMKSEIGNRKFESLPFFDECFKKFKEIVSSHRAARPTVGSKAEAQRRFATQIRTEQDLKAFKESLSGYEKMLSSETWRPAKTSFETYIGATRNPFWNQWIGYEAADESTSMADRIAAEIRGER